MKENTSWDSSEEWYRGCVGEKGHYYHESVILSGSIRLLDLKPNHSLLDLGCGQGVLERALPKTIQYTGIDNSKFLIAEAKKMSVKGQFFVADACKKLPLDQTFDAASFILSLQNMESPDLAIATAASHLKENGKLLIVLNHPCFRIPRQSHWGIDEQMKLQYRRMNVYMTPQKIPIQTNPSLKNKSSTTYTFHHPLSSYISWLSQNGLVVTQVEEWCSDKKSEGGRARMEDRARKEFPLFLTLLTKMQKKK
jgi:SAM-dependent methyltransferase